MHVSEWISPSGGTPQGTKSGPRDFKKVVKDMKTQLPLFTYVDDTTLYEVCARNTQSVVLQQSANEVKDWCDRIKMIINSKKMKEIVINFLKTDINIAELEINRDKIEQVQSSKLLGVTISDDLTWGEHVKNITAKATQRLFSLRLPKRAKVSMDKICHINFTIFCHQ